MAEFLPEDVLQRVADYAKAQAEKAARLRETAERRASRGRTQEAEALLAKEAPSAEIAKDLTKLLTFVRGGALAPTAGQAPADAANARKADAAALSAAKARLVSIAEAAGNAVTHLEKIAPDSHPVLIHANALAAFRWLQRTAAAPMPHEPSAEISAPETGHAAIQTAAQQ